MDIINIFRKVRDSYSMLHYSNTGKTKKYIKYNKNNVINLSDSEDSSISSSDEDKNNYFLDQEYEPDEKPIDITAEHSFKEAIESSVIRGLPFSSQKK